MIFYKEKFKEIRENRGVTLKQISIACDVTEATVQRWEKHPTLKPRPAKIPKLAAFLGCNESDLCKFGGPLEKALDAQNEEAEEIRSLLFGADVADEIGQIRRAVARRDEVSKKDPNYAAIVAEENAEIQENLRSMFRKIGRALKVADFPQNAKDDFRFGLLRALIKSDMAAVDKETALRLVEEFEA